MSDTATGSERETLTSHLDQLQASVEAAESAFDSEEVLRPAMDWLEDLNGKLEECEELLRSDEVDAPLDSEEIEHLNLWAIEFSDTINEGDEIEDECTDREEPPNAVASALHRLIANSLEPVRKESWLLHSAAIRAA